jgi:hypothetical protein
MMTDAQRELLEDKFILWTRASREGAMDLRDYNGRAADALKAALALASSAQAAEARATRAEAALVVFADVADELDDCDDLVTDDDRREYVTLGFAGMGLGDVDRDDFRQARAALQPQPQEPK